MPHRQDYRQSELGAGCSVPSIVFGIYWPSTRLQRKEGSYVTTWLRIVLWGTEDRS